MTTPLDPHTAYARGVQAVSSFENEYAVDLKKIPKKQGLLRVVPKVAELLLFWGLNIKKGWAHVVAPANFDSQPMARILPSFPQEMNAANRIKLQKFQQTHPEIFASLDLVLDDVDRLQKDQEYITARIFEFTQG